MLRCEFIIFSNILTIFNFKKIIDSEEAAQKIFVSQTEVVLVKIP